LDSAYRDAVNFDPDTEDEVVALTHYMTHFDGLCQTDEEVEFQSLDSACAVSVARRLLLWSWDVRLSAICPGQIALCGFNFQKVESG
jgi:hypothetical protein